MGRESRVPVKEPRASLLGTITPGSPEQPYAHTLGKRERERGSGAGAETLGLLPSHHDPWGCSHRPGHCDPEALLQAGRPSSIHTVYLVHGGPGCTRVKAEQAGLCSELTSSKGPGSCAVTQKTRTGEAGGLPEQVPRSRPGRPPGFYRQVRQQSIPEAAGMC